MKPKRRDDFMEGIRIKNPKFLLVYPPLQFTKGQIVRPLTTLSHPYLAASLAKAGYYSQILDMSIGTSRDKLEDTFYRSTRIRDNFFRVGMSQDRIIEEVKDFDVVAVTSPFTQQSSSCFEISKLIKKIYPEKLLIAGGMNAENLIDVFFEHEYDAIFVSESEKTLEDFANFLHFGTPAIDKIEGIAYKKDKIIHTNPPRGVLANLDDIPMPLWEELPNRKYWEIGRVWGGMERYLKEHINKTKNIKYASILTSRGCPFNCKFCHISKKKMNNCINTGRFRIHSLNRVEQDLSYLQKLDIEYVLINDDSFLASRKRTLSILDLIKKYKFALSLINGANICHFFKKDEGQLKIDEELIEALYGTGVKIICFGFESGNQRIIDKYCDKKWKINKMDTVALIKKLSEIGIAVTGNFMIGWPDESLEELENTFIYTKKMMDAGMASCGFSIVQPFPGTILFDESISNGSLSTSWHWDEFGWSKGTIFNNLKIDKKILEFTEKFVWRLLNSSKYTKEYQTILME